MGRNIHGFFAPLVLQAVLGDDSVKARRQIEANLAFDDEASDVISIGALARLHGIYDCPLRLKHLVIGATHFQASPDRSTRLVRDINVQLRPKGGDRKNAEK